MNLERRLELYAERARRALQNKLLHKKKGVYKGLNSKGQHVVEVNGKSFIVNSIGDKQAKPGDQVLIDSSKNIISFETAEEIKTLIDVATGIGKDGKLVYSNQGKKGAKPRKGKRKLIDHAIIDEGEKRKRFLYLVPPRGSIIIGLRFLLVQDNLFGRNYTVNISSGWNGNVVTASAAGGLNKKRIWITEDPLTNVTLLNCDSVTIANTSSVPPLPYYWHNGDLIADEKRINDWMYDYEVGTNGHTNVTNKVEWTNFGYEPSTGTFDVCVSGGDMYPNSNFVDFDVLFGSYNPLRNTYIADFGQPITNVFRWELDGNDCFSDYAAVLPFRMPSIGAHAWDWWLDSGRFWYNDRINIEYSYVDQNNTTQTNLLYSNYQSQNGALDAGGWTNYPIKLFVTNPFPDHSVTVPELTNSTPIMGDSWDSITEDGGLDLNTASINFPHDDQVAPGVDIIRFIRTRKNWRNFAMNIVYGYYYPESQVIATDVIYAGNSDDASYELDWSQFP